MSKLVFASLAIGIVALAASESIAAQTLKIATIAPEGSSWMTDMRAGAKEIEQTTQGRVKFKFYAGGVQGNDKQVQRKMRTGQLHGGAFTSGTMNRFQADADLFSLPMVFKTREEARHVRSKLEPELRQRLEDAGYVNFGFAAAGFAYMMSNKPLRTMKDLSGQKVWIPEDDPVGFAALRSLGVAPVVMPVTDVMTGLQTDLLDSVTVPPVGAVVFQWHTRLKYITDVPVSYVYAALLIDRKAFNKLQADDQQVVRQVMERVYLGFESAGATDEAEALQALRSSGLAMVETNPDEVDAWREAVNASHAKLASEGVFDRQLYEKLQSLLSDYRSIGKD